MSLPLLGSESWQSSISSETQSLSSDWLGLIYNMQYICRYSCHSLSAGGGLLLCLQLIFTQQKYFVASD